MIDLFDRKVIGWALSINLDATNTSIPTFKMAVKNRTAQTEEEKLNGKYSANVVRQAVFSYVEGYYNRERIYSALDYLAPNEYYSKKVA